MSDVHGFDLGGIVAVDDGAAQLEGVGELAGLDGELVGEEGETLDFLEAGAVGLELFDAGFDERADVFVAYEVGVGAEGDFLLAGVFAQGGEGGDDYGGDVFALVADDGHLLDVAVFAEAALEHLGGDVLAVGGLEEVLDALGEDKVAAGVEVSGVAGAEPSVIGECGLGLGRFVIIFAHDGGAFDLDFVVLADAAFYLGQQRAHRAGLPSRVGEAGDGGGGLGQAVADHDVEATGLEELHDAGAEGRSGGGEDVGVGEADGAAQQAEDAFVVELVLPFEHPGHLEAQTPVVDVAAVADV